MTAVAITTKVKQFTGEIVRALKDIGISLFIFLVRALIQSTNWDSRFVAGPTVNLQLAVRECNAHSGAKP